MDNRQQELRVLGFFGIIKAYLKIIFSRKKIFSQISLAFLIPITIIFQVKIVTAFLFSFNMFKNRADPEDPTVFIIPQYSYLNFSYIASGKWLVYWLLSEIGYLFLLLIFSILSTIPIARTTTSIYEAEDVTFNKATAVVPKFWKRVLITFLLVLAITFVYDYLLGPVLGLILRPLFFKKFPSIKLAACLILIILYFAVFVYITVICRLASVVSVMKDDMSGMKAITKSRKLIKGKMVAAIAVFVIILAFSAGVDTAFMLFVVYAAIAVFVIILAFSAGVDTAFMLFVVYGVNFLPRVIVGIGSFVSKFLAILLLFVVQTVIYFVCKSYHNENIGEYHVAECRSERHGWETREQASYLG